MTFIITHMIKTPRLLKEMFLLILFSTTLGILAQSILPQGIGIITEMTLISSDTSYVAIPTILINPTDGDNDPSNILILDALQIYNSGTGLFIDARSQEDFLAGHILGAINIPAHAFMDSLEFLDELNLDTPLITYCDGADCNASIDLAADLKLMGFSEVYFFFGGWQEWQTAGYPMESGN